MANLPINSIPINSQFWLSPDGSIWQYQNKTNKFFRLPSKFLPVNQNIEQADFYGWGDSMMRGTGSPTAPNLDTFVYYLGLKSNYKTFNRGVNGETSTQVKLRFDAEPSSWSHKTIFWAGRNDITGSVPITTIKDNLVAMTQSLGHNNYIVMGTVYKQSEPIGSANHILIDQLNSDLAVLFPNNFLNVNQVLIDAYNPSLPQDVTDHANGVHPTSLSNGDGTHLNSAGQLIVANYVFSHFDMLSKDQQVMSLESFSTALNNPPAIGSGIPNTGMFSYISMLEEMLLQTTTLPLLKVTKGGTYSPPSGVLFNIAEQTTITSTQSGGAGSLYNVGLKVDVSGSAIGGGNIALLSYQNIVLGVGAGTSGWNNRLYVGGTVQFGVAGSVNGNTLIAGTLTINQGTGGVAQTVISNSGLTGNAYFDIGNTGTGGITWRTRVGGNNANSSGGSGANEGSFSLSDLTSNKTAIHITKVSTNIGIHGQVLATAYLHFPAGLATAGNAPIKLTSGPLLTTPEVGAIEFLTDRLYFTKTTSNTREQIAYLSDIAGGGAVSNLALGTTTATTQPITNSNGTGFTLPSATTSLAGLMSAADKTSFNAIATTYAPLASPTFTGTPTLPTGTIGVTQTAGNNSTALATTAFVAAADTNNVKLTGAQTVAGNKTFSGSTEFTGSATATGQFNVKPQGSYALLTDAGTLGYSTTSSSWGLLSHSGSASGTLNLMAPNIGSKVTYVRFYPGGSSTTPLTVATTVQELDMEITDSTRGIILRDAGDSSRRRITVVNGVLTVSAAL